MVLLAPVLLGTVCAAVFVACELAGVTPPLAIAAPVNVAEAAGMGSAADVLRLLASGDDPARIHQVRPEIVSSSITKLTAFEAAIWSRRVELVQLLDQRASIDASRRGQLACLAQELRTEDILEYLSAGSALECSGSVSERIAARGR